MWQRIQTIFMALTAILMIASIFVPIWEKSGEEQRVTLTALEISYVRATDTAPETTTTVYLAVLAGLVALLSSYAILSFKNRMLQIRLNAINSFFIALFVGLSFYWIYTAEDWFRPGDHGSYLTGTYLPLIALISTILASRFIKKDEQLVRSMDRLR